MSEAVIEVRRAGVGGVLVWMLSRTEGTGVGGCEEILGVKGSCVQSNCSKVLQLSTTQKMVKMFDSTVNVFKLEGKCHGKEIFNLLSCLSNLQR